MPIRCCIVDDEPLAIKLLSGYVSKTANLELTLATTDPFSALEAVRSGKVDLVFLDIQMPELTGIQFMKIIDRQCGIIITSAYKDYALQGFEFDVIDYLLKPIAYEKFFAAVQKANNRMFTKQAAADVANYIFIKSDHRQIKVNFDEIYYLESFRDYITVHTTKDKILTLQSLRSFEETLPADKFIRIHKSHIVAIEKITAIENNRILIHDTFLPIGEVYKDQVNQRLQLKK
jgi:DNA-binding LytR/AlgR family response regulator